MSDTFRAHIFKHRSVGEREEVSIKLFDQDGSPFSGGGGGAAPVYTSKMRWVYEPPLVVPSSGNMNFTEAQVESMQGMAVNPAEPAKLKFPAGIYLLRLWFNWRVDTQDPSMLMLMLNAQSLGPTPPFLDGILMGLGPDTQMLSPTGVALDPSIKYLMRTDWGIAASEFTTQVQIYHDSPDLAGEFGVEVTRVAAL